MNEEVVLAFKRRKLKKLKKKANPAPEVIKKATGTDGRVYRNVTDHTGETFGRLTVTGFSHRYAGKSYYTCRCTCGTVLPVMYSHLLSGNTRSCGCYRKELSSKLYNKKQP